MSTAATESAPAGGWRVATVRSVDRPNADAVRLRLDVPDRVDHWPGQHYVVRLTAPDGYSAQRSYSVSSDPHDPQLELFIERLPDGEVSSYLADEVRPGDQLDIRGPIGGWFVWRADSPAVGIGGGTGVVPLVAMLRYAATVGRPDALKLAVSARTIADLPYAEELISAGAVVALSRETAASGRPAGRLTTADLRPLLTPDATYFVCGSAGFAESASVLLLGLGVPAPMVRVERFGPSG